LDNRDDQQRSVGEKIFFAFVFGKISKTTEVESLKYGGKKLVSQARIA
jgi:hypothetical protein